MGARDARESRGILHLIENRRRSSLRSWFRPEDWFAVWLGFAAVLIALPTAAGADLLVWVSSTKIWLDPFDAIRPVSAKYAEDLAAIPHEPLLPAKKNKLRATRLNRISVQELACFPKTGPANKIVRGLIAAHSNRDSPLLQDD